MTRPDRAPDRVRVWEDALAADGREVYLTFQLTNESIVVPETVDCIRALTGIERDGAASIARTDASLGITKAFLPRATRPIEHLAGPDIAHPQLEAMRRRRAESLEIGLRGSEELTEPEPAPEQRSSSAARMPAAARAR